MGMMIMRHPFFSFRVIWITCPFKGWSFDGLLWMSGKEKPDTTQPSKKRVSGWQ
jgi:hypothetical protein